MRTIRSIATAALIEKSANAAVATFCFVFAALALPGIAPARAEVAFPPINIEVHCDQLVSQVVDPNQKNADYEACFEEEQALRERLRPFWALVPDEMAKQCISALFYKNRLPNFVNLNKCMSAFIGQACIDNRLSCVLNEQLEAKIIFPELDISAYCTLLVSKMLVEDEKKVEYDKCVAEEIAIQSKLRIFWPLMSQARADECAARYFANPNVTNNWNLGRCMESPIGLACVDGTASCSAEN
ncbi:MAG TPA: hypothetical protein VMF90_26000 [Rhizobiaceae bacterium]|nr:hypothetical protein [Rhizobiaceae bacterium]